MDQRRFGHDAIAPSGPVQLEAKVHIVEIDCEGFGIHAPDGQIPFPQDH